MKRLHSLLSELFLVLFFLSFTFDSNASERIFTSINGDNPILLGQKYRESWNDGDTLSRRVDGEKTSYRLVGYNTLESYGPVHCWGNWSAEELFWLNHEKATTLARGKNPDISWERECRTKGKKDSYGRQLLICEDLAYQLIENGLAHVYDFNPKKKKARKEDAFFNKMRKKQKSARKNRSGFWKKGSPDNWIVTSLHSADEIRKIVKIKVKPGMDEQIFFNRKSNEIFFAKKKKSYFMDPKIAARDFWANVLKENAKLFDKSSFASLNRIKKSLAANQVDFVLNFKRVKPGANISFDRKYQSYQYFILKNIGKKNIEFFLNDGKLFVTKGNSQKEFKIENLHSFDRFFSQITKAFPDSFELVKRRKNLNSKLRESFYPVMNSVKLDLADLELKYRFSTNRVIDISTGASKQIMHERKMNNCEWWCYRSAKNSSESCMLYVPYKYRYHNKKYGGRAWCVSTSKKYRNAKPRFYCSDIRSSKGHYTKFFGEALGDPVKK